jgi:hypothetical protein
MPVHEVATGGGVRRSRTICPHGYSKESGHCEGPYTRVSVIFKAAGPVHPKGREDA